MHRRVAAAIVAALALGLASCGGAEPLTKAQLVRRADAVCQRTQRQAASLVSQEGADHRRIDLATLRPRVVALLRDRAERLEKLTPPDDLKDAYHEFVVTQRDQEIAAITGRQTRTDTAGARAVRATASFGFRMCT